MDKNSGNSCRLIHNCLWTYILAYFTGVTFVNEESKAVVFLGIVPVILLSLVVYKKAGTLWLYLPGQMILGAACVAAGNLAGECVSYVLVFLIMVMCQIFEKRSPLFGPLLPGVPMLFGFAVLYFLALYFKKEDFMTVCLYAAMAEAVLMVLYNNGTGLYRYLDVRRNIGEVPLTQIRRTNRLFMAAFLLGMTVVFLLTTFFMDNAPLTAALSWLAKKLADFFRKMIQGESETGGSQLMPEYSVYEITSETTGGTSDVSVSNPQLTSLLNVLAYAFLVVILAGAVFFAIRAIIRYITDRLTQDTVFGEDEGIDDEITDIRDNSRTFTRAGREKISRMRKIYKREIRKKRRQNKRYAPVNPAYTPSQIEADSMESDPASNERERIEELHEQYEVHRYGNLERGMK